MMDAAYTSERISSLWKEGGMTQQELAELLHVTNKAVSKLERGKNFPDLPLLQPLAEILGATVADLLGVEQPITNETIAVLSAISQQEKKSINAINLLALIGFDQRIVSKVHERADRYISVGAWKD